MKELNELADRIDTNDEIIDNLVKKSKDLENQIKKTSEASNSDVLAALDAIASELSDIKKNDKTGQQLDILNAIASRLENPSKIVSKQYRFLLFPETNQGQYYKIVFGRLIPWSLCFLVTTYLFIVANKAAEIYRYNQNVNQAIHYEKAWLYLQQHAKKKTLSAMDEAYGKTEDN